MKILLVEDEELTRSAAATVLRKMGAEVVVGVDGQDALSKFDKSIDLIITDFCMPHLDGIQLIEKIRKISQVVIVLITAGDITNAGRLARKAGANRVLPKEGIWTYKEILRWASLFE
jgi:DNA-binding response OmpR family regulator